MNTIIVENAKAAALFAQATNSNDLGFRQYRGNRFIITWTDGIPLNKEVTVRDKGDVHIQLSDEQSSWLAVIKIAEASSDRIYVATDSRDTAFWLLSFMPLHEIHDKVIRIHIREMTVKGVRESFNNIEPPGHFIQNIKSELFRRRHDGILRSATDSLITKSCGTATYKLGRIRTPLLSMIALRFKEWHEIMPKAEYRVHLVMEHQGRTFRFTSDSSWNTPAETNAAYIRLKRAEERALITHVSCRLRTEKAPKLFNMSTLMRTANERHSLTIEQIAASTRRLYEWGLITYPFTNADSISIRKVRKIHRLLEFLHDHNTLGASASRIEMLSTGSLKRCPCRGHHGIMITGMKLGPIALRMNYADKVIYNLICTRMVEAFSPASLVQTITAGAMAAGISFSLSESYIQQRGWKSVEDKSLRKEEPIERELLWPTNSKVGYNAVSITKRVVKPDKPYSEGELLCLAHGMKLGTSHEIADALKELIEEGYVYRSEDGLKPTEKGSALYAIVKGQPIADIDMMATLERYIRKYRTDDIPDDPHHPFQLDVYDTAVSELAGSSMLFPNKPQNTVK